MAQFHRRVIALLGLYIIALHVFIYIQLVCQEETKPAPSTIATHVHNSCPHVVAYGLMVHKYLQVTEIMFHKLYHPCHIYMVHLDASMDTKDPIYQFFHEMTNKENVFVVKNPVDVNWGGIQLVEAQLLIIKEILHLKMMFHTFMWISETHYPLQPPEDMAKILQYRLGQSVFWGTYMQEKHKNRLPPPPNPPGVVLASHSQWCILSYEAAVYLVEGEVAKSVLAWAQTGGTVFDEWLILTILLSSPLSPSVVFTSDINPYHDIMWDGGDGNHPRSARMVDLPRMLTGRRNHLLFLRKVDDESIPVIEVFEQHIAK